MKAGKTEVIIGTMFSGKTKTLIKKFKKSEATQGIVPIAIKPSIDNRFIECKITSHDEASIEANEIRDSHDAQKFLEGFLGMVTSYEHVVIYIDEVQFFDDDIIFFIQDMNMQGVDVICSGLPIDRFGMPFGAMPDVMAIADKITRVDAKCKCGNDAYVSMGKAITDSNQIAIGAEEYEKVCKDCFLQL